MNTVTTLLLAMLATARLTRFVTTDRIFLAPRRAILRRLDSVEKRKIPGADLLSYMVVCDWCVSVYTGGAVAAAWVLAGGTLWFQAPVAALALSYAAGFLASKEGGE